MLKGKERVGKEKLPKVSVIDDDTGVLAVMEHLLLKMGYQAKREHPDIPVIMLTALGCDDNAVKESIGLGASGYVSKTSGFRGLKEVIDNVMLTRK
jgi:DNA-binding NarL/FixJ family response regulator